MICVTDVEFQFQYGAIKSELALPDNAPINVFQFQYGAIKREFECTTSTILGLFQFQYGAIKRVDLVLKSAI